MNKTLLTITLSLVAMVMVTGCGRPLTVEERIQKANETRDREKLLQTFGEIATEKGIDEANNLATVEGVAVPANFPKEFIYPNTKVVSVDDTSSGNDITILVVQKTADENAVIKAYYDKLLPKYKVWDVRSPTAGEGYSWTLYNMDNANQIYFIITRGKYEKVSTIDITYIGTK